MNTSSPASTGPAGSRFEGQVGAHYLLTMLALAEPRGLPGTTISRVEFQRGDDGYPLDDVVIHAHENTTGNAVKLQIQVKRTIQFSPGDAVFRKVVGQIAEAIAESGFWTERNELAIATAGTSRKIDGAYQDVLRWARQLGSATVFFERLNRRGTANTDMQTFVSTLRGHLHDAGASNDDETVWKVLKRLQILIFDYTAVGSAAEELSRERAVRVLPPEDAAKASILWRALIDLSEEVAADGGDRNSARLLADLANMSIHVGGARILPNVRVAVAEASEQALADIVDHIGETTLARTERVEAVNEMRDQGRFIEIRGDAGVGKSGILKHFAKLFATEGRVVVLSPGRIQPRGWGAMRAILGFNGTARDLLGDLASDGGAALFIDNLDSIADDERSTVNDLLRAASEVPGITVIVTARRDFGVYEPSWMDMNAIAELVPAPPMVIEELSEAEVAELRDAQPRLAGLLADGHPAREVVRNLYRMSRLAAAPKSTPIPTTEIDMAEQWWKSADGELDAGRRERARILRSLAEMALRGDFALDVKDAPAAPIDALVKSETIRDLGVDKVTFRHDVLRQWAIGCLLAEDDTSFAQLPLDKPALAIPARGVELAARFALVRQPNGNRWRATMDVLSREGTNGSWRRAALLAFVHSENAAALLDREATMLLDNGAALLRELIRTVIAVDTEPVSQLLVQLGVNPAEIPAGMFVPRGASWIHLLVWLLKLGSNVPAHALDDVVELYKRWMLGTFGYGQLTPNLLAWLHAWLVELEQGRISDSPPRNYRGNFVYGEGLGLVKRLRTGFLMFANKRPDLAADYLNRVRAYEQGGSVVSSIMKFRGTLAQAAPKELAALTAENLIARRDEGAPHDHKEPFKFLDRDFLPANSAQGPFLELLTHAPDEGLALIQKLANHAIQFRVRGRDPGADGLQIAFDDGERFFPWVRSYRWSRGDDTDYAVASGLMALEAWAHQCVERGDGFETVLKDVLGPAGTPAAFLLVAVDLIISHWPKSQSAAVPFLACPELVSLDRTRQHQDKIEPLDLFGLKALEKETVGNGSHDGLKQRPSRRVPLEQLVGNYGAFGPEELRAKLDRLLQVAAQRLGSPEPTSGYADPRFMVRHELNLVDPENWLEREVDREDGTTVIGREYLAPQEEVEHVAALSAGLAAKLASANIRAELLLAMNNPLQSSPEIAAQGIIWAQEKLSQPKNNDIDEEEGDEFIDGEGIRAAALVAIRDGEDELRRNHESWAERVLLDALKADDDVAHRLRSGLKFNPVATAFAGLAELYCRDPTMARIQTLLEIAARESPAGAHGFATKVADLAAIDERIPKAIARCGFAACVKPICRADMSEEEVARRAALYAEQTKKAVEDELAWLSASAPEPTWPDFKPVGSRQIRRRHRGVRMRNLPQSRQPEESRPPATTDIDEQAAALWIGALLSIADVSARPWLREFVEAYSDFSAELNGLGLSADEELLESPDMWNNNFYVLLARTVIGLDEFEIDRVAVARITALPDQPFYGIIPVFLRAIDVIYFNEHLLDAEAPIIRRKIIDRLVASSGWRRLVGSRSKSIEWHLAPAVGAIFFNEYLLRRTATYLTPKAVERLHPFLPALTDLLTHGPNYFVALVTMDLLEVSPDSSLLPVLVAGGKAWILSYEDDTSFWVEHGIGGRLCAWIEKISKVSPEALAPDKPERQAIDNILALITRLGVAEARLLEASLVSV